MARLIDADEAIKWQWYGNTNSILYRQYAVEVLENAPTVEAVPIIHGYWIDMQEDDATGGMWRCSVCSSDRYFDIMTPAECGCYYCPNCGAKMDLKSEEAN